MWELGHTFEEIDSMSLQDFGDVIGYWSENQRADEKLKKKNETLSGRGKKRSRRGR